MNKDNIKILDFLKEIDKYKLVKRKIYCSDKTTRESDADHSWHMAMFLICYQKQLPKGFDFVKALKLALIHDLPEIYAGDPLAFDEKARIGKEKRERDAAKKLFALLPKDLEKEFHDLFNEYENNKTIEAKFVKSFDKIQATLQLILSDGRSIKEYNATYEDMQRLVWSKIHIKDQFLKDLSEYTIQESGKTGAFNK